MPAKKKLDILIISRSYPSKGIAGSTHVPGGVETHVEYLTNELTRITKGPPTEAGVKICNVHILTVGRKRGGEGRPPNLVIHRLRGRKGHFASAGEVPLEDPVRYCLDNWYKIRPDVIHAHDFEGIQIGTMLKAAFKTRLIVTIHRSPREWEVTLPQRDAKECYIQAMLDFSMVDKLVAPSTAYENRLLFQGFDPKSIAVIPHGVPVGRLQSLPNIATALQPLRLQEKDELILCPARLHPHKDLPTFVKAIPILKDNLKGRNLVFVIAGAGSQKVRRELEDLARSLSVENDLRIERFDHSEMPTLYRRAKACVLPSKREGFGQVLLEAFVYRTPVVAAHTGGIPDIITAGVNGRLFTWGEPEDLAHQLKNLLDIRPRRNLSSWSHVGDTHQSVRRLTIRFATAFVNLPHGLLSFPEFVIGSYPVTRKEPL